MSSNCGIASSSDRAEVQHSIGKKEESGERLRNLTNSALTIYNKYSRIEPIATVKKFLFATKKTPDTELSIGKLCAPSDVYDKFSRRELVSSNRIILFRMEKTVDMKVSIEKIPEQMMYERFLFQKVMQQLSKTDGTQELFELLPKQPHELKHFPAISLLDQIKMLTDGHQDSERIAHLFGMLISLAPAIILPQQSEIVLSYVELSDILLSLLDQFPEVCVQYTV